MGLEQVVQEILAEGKREAEAIERQAEQEAEELLQEARQEARRLEEQRAEEAKAQAESQARRIKASAQLEGKKARLNAESDVLASVRSRVEQRLRGLPADERAELLEALVESSGAHELGKGAVAWAREEDREAVESLGFSFEEPIDCLGGAIIEGPEGDVREDLRFETVLERVWREAVHDVAQQLEK